MHVFFNRLCTSSFSTERKWMKWQHNMSQVVTVWRGHRQKKRTEINRASRYSVSQILLLPGRSTVLPSYCNPCEESKNLKPETSCFLLGCSALWTSAQWPRSQHHIMLKISLISCLSLSWSHFGGLIKDINLVPLSWTCLNFRTGRRFLQEGWTLFLPWLHWTLPHSAISHPVHPPGQHRPLSPLCPQLSFLSETHPGAHHSQWHHVMRCGSHSYHPLLAPWVTLASDVSLSSGIARLQQAMVSQWGPLTQSHPHITFYLTEPAVRICHLYFHFSDFSICK